MKTPAEVGAAGALLLLMLSLVVAPAPGAARGVPAPPGALATPSATTRSVARPAAGKRDLENDIDFDGPVSSGEQQASVEQVLSQARGVAVDAEATVVEVQRILERHPKLPRLSRADILAILDNITRSATPEDAATTAAYTSATGASGEVTDGSIFTTEASTATDGTTPDGSTSATTLASRGEHARELMVVLPFSAKNLSESNIKELFTKAPLTHIIGDQPGSEYPTRPPPRKNRPHRRRRPVSTTTPASTTLLPSTAPASLIEYRVTENLDSDAPPPPQEVFFNPLSQRTRLPEKKRPHYAEQQQRWRAPTTATPSTDTLPEEADADYTTKRRGSTDRPWRGQRRTTAAPTTTTSTPTEGPVEPTVVPSNHKPFYTEPTVKPWRVTTLPPVPTSTKKAVSAIKQKPDYDSELAKKPAPTGWSPVSTDSRLAPRPTARPAARPTARPTARPAPARGAAMPSLYDMKKGATTPRPVLRDDVKDLLASIGLKTGAVAVSTPKRSTVAPSTSTTTTTTEPPVPNAANAAESLTPEMKDILMSIGLLPGKDEPPSVAPVAPALPTITTQPVVPAIDPSSYVHFKPLPLASQSPQGPEGVLPSPQVSEDMQEFLASFGLVPAIQSARIVSTPDEYLSMDELSHRGGKSLPQDGVEQAEAAALTAAPARPADASADAETDPDNTSYAELGNEEPLPTIVSAQPGAKALSAVPLLSSDALALPDDMKAVLDSLGLTDGASQPRGRGAARDSKRIDGHGGKNEHVFNPVEHSAKLDDRREAEKVIKLLSSIRVLPVGPNGTAIIPESVVADLAASTTVVDAVTATTPRYGFRKKQPTRARRPQDEHRLEEADGPSPLSTEELRLFLEAAKNEVKRQQAASSSSSSSSSSSDGSSSSSSSSSDSTATTGYDENAAELPTTVSDSLAGGAAESASSDTTPSTTTSTTTTTTTTTTEAPTANLDDLAASFGGDGDRPKVAAPVDTLPPARPNGLYFLFDWNTFLNVGEEGKNPVKLNFAPRIGDPKRFIEVKVP